MMRTETEFDEEPSKAKRPIWRPAQSFRVGSVAVIVLGLLVIARQLPVGLMVGALSAWVRALGAWGPVVYGVIYVAAVVALLPASALTIAAGAMFGPVLGTIIVSLGSTTGAALAFLIARHLARDAVARYVRRYPRFEAIDRAVGTGGWKIVALLRLSPAVPFNLQNYLYGLTRIGFWACVLTSWATMLPGTLMYVYLGHAGRASLEAASGQRTRTPVEWAILSVGLLATVVVTVYVTRLARRVLREPAEFADGPVDPSDETNEQVATGWSWGLTILGVLALCVLILAVSVTARPDLIEGLIRPLVGSPHVVLREAYAANIPGPSIDH